MTDHFVNGWVPNQDAYDNLASECPIALGEVPYGEDIEEICLFDAATQLDGVYYPTHHQLANSCTSHGIGGAIDQAQLNELAYDGGDFLFEEAATEAIYGGAIVNVGRSRGDNGAVVAYGLRWCQGGYLTRGLYKADGREYNLRKYSKENDLYFCMKGVSQELSQFATRKIAPPIPVKSFDEAVKLFKRRVPIVNGSNRGFTLNRDTEGFCKAQGNWAHCVYFAGFILGRRPGAFYQQSWGPGMPRGNSKIKLPSGREITLPEGCFLVDADVFERDMCIRGESMGVTLESGMKRLMYGR